MEPDRRLREERVGGDGGAAAGKRLAWEPSSSRDPPVCRHHGERSARREGEGGRARSGAQ